MERSAIRERAEHQAAPTPADFAAACHRASAFAADPLDSIRGYFFLGATNAFAYHRGPSEGGTPVGSLAMNRTPVDKPVRQPVKTVR